MHLRRNPLLSFVALLSAAAAAQAITYIVPPDRDLVKKATGIVIGTAEGSHPELTVPGGVVTVANFRVEAVLKGPVSGDLIRIVELGGFMSEHAMMIPGSPRYEEGARYLVFLDRWPDGAWRTAALQLGQFEVTTDLRGVEYFSRGGDESIFGLDARDGSLYVDRFRKADEFETFVRALARDSNAPAAESYFVDRAAVMVGRFPEFQPRAKLLPVSNFTRFSYLLSGNFRWQNGGTATFGYCCPGGYPASPLNAPGAAGSAVGNWNIAATSINYTLSGETPGKTSGLGSPDGSNTILFNDPNNLLSCCPGAVAIGGISQQSGPYILGSDGLTYSGTTEVDVVVEKNASLPGFIDQPLLAALLTHEVGHTLGFRHADGTASPTSPPPACDVSTDCANPGAAVMAHIVQSPALGLQTWDRNAAQTVYGSGPACTPPSITVQPQGSSINSGQSANLSVTAAGSGPLTYQWFVGASGNTSSPVNGATNSSASVSPTSTTQYWVRVTGQCAPPADSAAVTVTVLCVPVITVQPVDQSVSSGGTVILSVTFTSATTVAVTWFRGIQGDTSQSVGTGASITSPAISSQTNFWARLTNVCGNTDTRTVTVSIASSCVPPTSVSASASPTSINAGDQVALQASVGNGTNPLQFQWFRGTSPDESNPINGATAFSINDSPSSTTSYWVKVTNACGVGRGNTVTVTVTGVPQCTPPSISTQPPSQTIVIGTSASLSVAAAGTATLHFAWFQGSSGDESHPVGSDSATYKTPSLTLGAPFWVKVTNSCGNVSSVTATISLRTGRPRAVHH